MFSNGSFLPTSAWGTVAVYRAVYTINLSKFLESDQNFRVFENFWDKTKVFWGCLSDVRLYYSVLQKTVHYCTTLYYKKTVVDRDPDHVDTMSEPSFYNKKRWRPRSGSRQYHVRTRFFVNKTVVDRDPDHVNTMSEPDFNNTKRLSTVIRIAPIPCSNPVFVTKNRCRSWSGSRRYHVRTRFLYIRIFIYPVLFYKPYPSIMVWFDHSIYHDTGWFRTQSQHVPNHVPGLSCILRRSPHTIPNRAKAKFAHA